MRVVWTAPAAGSCAATEYFVRIFKTSDKSIPEQGDTPNLEYVATKLEPSTGYDVEVWAYGASCDNYSTTPGTYRLPSTNSSNNANDPEPLDSQPPMAGNPPGAVTVSKSGTSATLTWSAPTADASRCPHTDYSWAVTNRTNNSAHTKRGDTAATTATVTGLTSGDKYLIEVWSYSIRPCDRYSASSKLWWTQ